MALGGFHSIAYVLKKARQAGGLRALLQAMRSSNACKTCGLGMGGQRGGMVDEKGSYPEFCKKNQPRLKMLYVFVFRSCALGFTGKSDQV